MQSCAAPRTGVLREPLPGPRLLPLSTAHQRRLSLTSPPPLPPPQSPLQAIPQLARAFKARLLDTCLRSARACRSSAHAARTPSTIPLARVPAAAHRCTRASALCVGASKPCGKGLVPPHSKAHPCCRCYGALARVLLPLLPVLPPQPSSNSSHRYIIDKMPDASYNWLQALSPPHCSCASAHPPPQLHQVSVGGRHTCGIKLGAGYSDGKDYTGRLFCFGRNTEKQCDVPNDVKDSVWLEVSAGACQSVQRVVCVRACV